MNRKRQPGQGHGADGMSLLECLAYIAIVTMVMNVAAKSFVSSMRLSALGKQVVNNLDLSETIRRDFTETVRTASGVCPQIGDYHTGEQQLILRLPPRPDDGAQRYAVLGRLTDEPRLYNIILSDDGSGKPEIATTRVYRRDFAAIRFAYDKADVAAARLITLRVGPLRRSGRGNRPAVVHTFSAALRHMD